MYTVYILPFVSLVQSLHDINAQQQTTKSGSSLMISSLSSTSAASMESTSTTSMTSESSAEQRAISWLFTQRDPRDFGFRNDTALVLITIQLARSLGHYSSILPEAIDIALAGKQLEVETVVSLWRHSTIPPPPLRLALSCLALSSLCRDPRQFHGHDLIGALLHNHHQQESQQQSDQRHQHQTQAQLQLQHLHPAKDNKDRDGDVNESGIGVPHLSDLEFGYAMLAACAARVHVRKRDVRRLLDVAGSPQRHNIDTLSITIMTLRCIIVYDHRHRNWLHSIRKPSLYLARQQLADGSFGNVYNTVLAMQALTTAHSSYWSATDAHRWLELHQDPDGAFTDPGLTSMAIMALMGTSMDAVRRLGDSSVCGDNAMSIAFSHSGGGEITDIVDGGEIDGASDTGGNGNNNSISLAAAGGVAMERDIAASLDRHLNNNNLGKAQYYLPSININNNKEENQQQQNVTVSYTLWIGQSNISSERVLASVSITTTAVRNATFYTVMVLAAELDPAHFAFEASQWPNGHYVHTIAGHREEPMGYHYWLLYRLDNKPDPQHPPGSHQVAPVGVDDLLVEDGDHFLFWYKKL